ncbi:tail fiber protein [Yersinia bercovieri]|uniref:tail fiber protein n=1 Tax=Yersinia bercovieri TaxID=634 RepID=UPI0011A8FD4A|nr:phage tail protein [Yersinia bercovieri]
MANEILPFGLGAESNVMTQAEYEALAARSGGFSSGVAKSEQLNKVWRQSSFVASVLADFIANQSGNNVLDDGNAAVLLANLELAIKTYANSNLPIASTSQKGITQLSSLTNSSSETLAATLKAVKAVSDAGLKIAGNLAEIKAAGPTAVAEAQANLNLAALLGDALQKANNLSEIKDAGPAAVALTLLNLGLGDAAKLGVATNSQMATGTSTSLLPSVAAVMSLFAKRSFTGHDYIRIPDVPGGLIIQWGVTPNYLTNTIGVTSWNHSLPIPFPSALLGGTTTAMGTSSPLTSAANLTGAPNLSGPVSTVTGSVQNARNDQSVAIIYIVIGY